MRFPLLALLFTATTPIHAGGLYWSDRPAGAGNPHAIRACNFDGSNLRTLSNLGSADPRADPRGVAVDIAGGRVYFLARNSGGSSGELRSVDFSGANPLQHATTLSTPADLRLDAVNRTLYWCEEAASGTIKKAVLPMVPGVVSPQALFSAQPLPYYLDLDVSGGKIYWGDSGGSIYRGPIGGGVVEPPIVTGGANMRGVCVDVGAEMLYWCEKDGTRRIRRRAISGGAIQDVYTGLNAAHGLVLDLPAGKLYWVDTGTNGGGFNGRGVSRGDLDGSGAAEIVVAGTAANQPWDVDLDRRTPTYAEWVGRFFRLNAANTLTDRLADPDGDGANNLLEYGTGTPPLKSSAGNAGEAARVSVGGTEYSAIRYRRRANATDLTYVVQVADQLPNWKDNSMAGGPYTEVFSTEPAEDGLEWATVRSLVPLNPGSTEFFRVRVETPAFGAAIAAPVSAKATKRTR